MIYIKSGNFIKLTLVFFKAFFSKGFLKIRQSHLENKLIIELSCFENGIILFLSFLSKYALTKSSLWSFFFNSPLRIPTCKSGKKSFIPKILLIDVLKKINEQTPAETGFPGNPKKEYFYIFQILEASQVS